MKKQSYYMVIPASVWESNLSDKTILLYGHIATLANKEGYAFALDDYFAKALKCSTRTVQYKLKELESAGVITRKVVYAEDGKTIVSRKIYLASPATEADFTSPIEVHVTSPSEAGVIDNNTSNNNTSINIIDDAKGKIFFKIVELYPKNRIGNRQHGLKKFKKLDIEEAKLALKNLNRYLDVSNGYVKSLQNYIDQECFSEEWLKAEEETKANKANITNNTKKFNTNYDEFI